MLSRYWVVLVASIWAAAPVYAGLTHLNELDKDPTVQLTADQLGVIFTEWGHHGVRSDKPVNPGSGFYYFEGRRELGLDNYGFGVASAAAPLDTYGGATDQSLGVNVLGACFVNDSFAGNLSGTQDTYGFAVDYRGPNPVIHLIVSQTLAGSGEYLKTITLTNVTGPVYILVYGNNSLGAIQQTINGGDDLGAKPFRYDARAALTAAYFVPIDGIEELVNGWGIPDPGLNQHPTVSPGPDRTVIEGNPVTATATGFDNEDGDLTGALVWSDSAGPATANGGSFLFTPTGLGPRALTATVTDSAGAVAGASLTLTVIAHGAVDSDGDGLSFDQEVLLQTDPSRADSDGDGLSDGDEVAKYFTNPLSPDSEGDGMSDRFEALCGLFPNLDDAADDPDGDGFDNGAEFAAATEPLSHLSYPGKGAVLLNPADKHASVGLTNGGLGAAFSGPGVAGVRSVVSILPGSGWFYFEGHREVAPGDFGFGVASAAAPLNGAGGADDQSMGINALGGVSYDGQQVDVFADPAAVATYGLAVDYSGAMPIVYPIVEDALGNVAILDPVVMTAVAGPVFIFVFGTETMAGTQQTINAGGDPGTSPFHFPAAYQLFLAGHVGAEFLGSGWGPDHAYAGRPEVDQYDPVVLVKDADTGAGISLGPQRLGVSYSVNDKMAIRANQGMIGQFRYFESFRSVGPSNIGQGLITAFGTLNPYCCVSPSLDGAPPSMSVNSGSSIWRNLVSQAVYDTANSTYGFAVDYRGSRPIVYCIIGGALVHTLLLDDVFTPLFPMLYGNPQGLMRSNTANFGASPFFYDARQILTNAGIDAGALILGWGDVNDGESPQITGQQQVTIAEDTPLDLLLAHLTANDPNTSYPAGFSLTVLDGTNYSRSGNTITPAQNYHGKLAVPVRINDGVFDSKIFKLIVRVTPVNDAPEITGQVPLATDEDTALAIDLAHLTVTDPDNDYPAGFSLTPLAGSSYTVQGQSILPDLNFFGELTVPVRVSDGLDESDTFNLTVQVAPVNDPPQILGQQPLLTELETPLEITLDDVSFSDPDNASPLDFSLALGDGANYTRSALTITPAVGFGGELLVPARVSDGQDESLPFLLSVMVACPLPTIDQSPSDQEVCLGSPAAFAVTVSGLGTPSYQWRRDGMPILNATGADYLVASAQPFAAGLYDCVVRNGCQERISDAARLTVLDPVAIDVAPLGSVTCAGESASFEVTVSGAGPLAYQWRRDGMPIDGATSRVLAIPAVDYDDEGDYDCVVGGACGDATSSSAALSLDGALAVAIDPGSAGAGLNPLILTAAIGCAQADATWQWQNVSTGEWFGDDQNPVVIDPLPAATTLFRIAVADGLVRESVSASMILLVALNPAFWDWNGDGCNGFDDLFAVMEDWRQISAALEDPNGDGIIDVRDFLYLSLQDGAQPCQP